MKTKRLLLGVVALLVFAIGMNAQPEGYCVPEGVYNVVISPEDHPQHNNYITGPTARFIKTITISGATFGGSPVAFTKDVSPTEGRTNIYYDKTSEVLNATEGDVLTVSWTKSANMTWMHYYVYIDYDQDGIFNQTDELVSYTFWGTTVNKGYNSKGQAVDQGADFFQAPSFTIPTSALKGATRLRFKVDWNCKNPCENDLEKNFLYKNAGSIIDFTINILGETNPVLTIEAPEGGQMEVVNAEGIAVETGAEVESGTELIINTIPDKGLHLKHILINGMPSESNKVTVYEDMTISAVFSADWNLKYDISEGGNLVVTKTDGTPVETDTDLAPDTEVKAVLTILEGYELVAVTLNGNNAKDLFTEENNYTATLTMTENQKLLIMLAKKQYAVTLTKVGSGVLSAEGYDDIIAGESILIEHGTEIKINVIPDECDAAVLESFAIDEIDRIGDLEEEAPNVYSITLTVIAPLAINAVFDVPTYAVTFNITGEARITLFDTNTKEPVADATEIPVNSELSWRIEPADGWNLKSVEENGNPITLNQIIGGVYEIGWILDNYTYDIVLTSPVGLSTDISETLSIYYNDGKLYICGAQVNTVAGIYDLTGKAVMKIDIDSSIDVSTLSNGCYLVKVTKDNDTKVLKFIKD